MIYDRPNALYSVVLEARVTSCHLIVKFTKNMINRMHFQRQSQMKKMAV